MSLAYPDDSKAPTATAKTDPATSSPDAPGPATAPAPATAPTEAPQSAEPAALRKLVSRIEEISTLPAVALRVIEVASDPESGAQDLRQAMEADPALCVRVLRCVNSAAFGLRESVEDLARAVAYLGFNQIRDLAITATVSGLFRSPAKVGKYERANLWRHLVAVGVASRMIATRTRTEGFEYAFLAGLLHDVGIVLFDQHDHEAFAQVMVGLNGELDLPTAERQVVGWDHAQLGEAVAKNWRLPEVICATTRWHHDPSSYSGPHEKVVHTVAVANLICSAKELSSVGWNLLGLSRDSLAALGIDPHDLKIFADDLEAELEQNSYLFDLQTNG